MNPAADTPPRRRGQREETRQKIRSWYLDALFGPNVRLTRGVALVVVRLLDRQLESLLDALPKHAS